MTLYARCLCEHAHAGTLCSLTVEPSLPVLVARVSDRTALARLLRAALRHEIADVALTEPPRDDARTLDLMIDVGLIGSTGDRVSLLAEPAGVPHDGQFPLRLHPRDGAQIAELCALLEADRRDPPPLHDATFEEEPTGSHPFFDEALARVAMLVDVEVDPAKVVRHGGEHPHHRVSHDAHAYPIEGTLARGRKIGGKYVIESMIGCGAAGAVYEAVHRDLRRSVAIKVLHPSYQRDPLFMKSFRAEALAASQLDHPNVTRVLDFGQEADGLVYIVMEHLSGRTLQQILADEERLDGDRAAEIMVQVCAALSVAHDNGIIHRDIKPDNIMLVSGRNDEGGSFELVKVCDFGIAALQSGGREDADFGISEEGVAGTPEYMSPEQAQGIEIDARSDVYAAGICLYELVTGRPPFEGAHPGEILLKQVEAVPAPPSRVAVGIDPLLEEIILRAIQKDPAKRQQSARELRVELKELLEPVSSPADEEERSIVESVPALDDPASGFQGFFIALASALQRFTRFERGHPEAARSMKDLQRATKAALRGRAELTFARGKTALAFFVMSGHGEIADLRRLLGSQLYASLGEPFLENITKRGIAALTIREGISQAELTQLVDALIGPECHEQLRKTMLTKAARHVSILFAADVVGRDRPLTWKVGLCAARLTRDLRALSSVRGISVKKMRELRDELVLGVAHLLTKGEEVRQFLVNADLVDSSVSNLRGFSGFEVGPLVVSGLLHEPCADAVTPFLEDLDRGEQPARALEFLRALGMRLVHERSTKSDAAVAELYRRAILTEPELPADLHDSICAETLADELVARSNIVLANLDDRDADSYRRELARLGAACFVLARRAEARALLAVVAVLALHTRTDRDAPNPNAADALAAMKAVLEQDRLVPIARMLLARPTDQRSAARQLLVIAGTAGARALCVARKESGGLEARAVFIETLRATGPAGSAVALSMLPRMALHDEADVALVEDLLRAMPDRVDAALGDAVARFLAHPRLRPTALAAIGPLWGERARQPLMDALEFGGDPTRIVALVGLRRMGPLDEPATSIIERLLSMKGTASEELRAAAAASLVDVARPQRARATAYLSRAVEGRRGIVAMIRGDDLFEESAIVTEAMARALLALDRDAGVNAIKARAAKCDAPLRARLLTLLRS